MENKSDKVGETFPKQPINAVQIYFRRNCSAYALWFELSMTLVLGSIGDFEERPGTPAGNQAFLSFRTLERDEEYISRELGRKASDQ